MLQDVKMKDEGSQDETHPKNLTISNSIKGILHMSFDSESNNLYVIENLWKKTLQNF